MKRLLCLLPALMLTGLKSTAIGEEEATVVHREVEIGSENGLTLRGYLEGPAAVPEAGEGCPLIILMHGLMDSGEFELIRKQADACTAAGYAVLAVDFDGHGRSDGRLIDMTISRELQDAEAILAFAEEQPFVSEIILIGHSQGGVIASVTAARHSDEIGRLVLLAPGGMLADKLRSCTCFGTAFDPADPPEKVMVFDDYVGRDYIVDAMAMDLYAMAEGYHDHAVLLIAGGADPLVAEPVVRQYESVYTQPELNNSVTFTVIPDAPHDFAEHEHEVTEAVLAFLAD